MTSVRETITTALGRIPRGYEYQVDIVIRALEARDAEIADNLRTAANGMGAARNDVDQLLIEVGLVPPPVPAQVPNNSVRAELRTTGDPGVGNADPDLAATVAELSRTVRSLVDAARANGIRV